jgi:hypothetical protein
LQQGTALATRRRDFNMLRNGGVETMLLGESSLYYSLAGIARERQVVVGAAGTGPHLRRKNKEEGFFLYRLWHNVV